jgi:hypothetical protein
MLAEYPSYSEIGPLRVFSNALQFGLDPSGFQIRIDSSGVSNSSGLHLSWDDVGDYSLDLTPYGKAPRTKATLRYVSYLFSPVGGAAAAAAPGGEDYFGISSRRPHEMGVGGVLPHRRKTHKRERAVIQEMLSRVMQETTRTTVLSDPREVLHQLCRDHGVAVEQYTAPRQGKSH